MPDRPTKPPFRLIAVALGILALLFIIGGWNLPLQAPVGCPYSQSRDNNTENKCNNKTAPTLGFLIRSLVADGWDVINDKDRLLVFFTAALAAFTYFLFRATARLVKHTPQIERAYISGGGAPVVRMAHDVKSQIDAIRVGVRLGDARIRIPSTEFELYINNHGKTPGELFKIGIGWCEAMQVPPKPDYGMIYFRDWIGPGTQGRPLHKIAIPQNLSYPAIYVRLYYKDIFGDDHSSGFILAISMTGASPVLASPEYTSAD